MRYNEILGPAARYSRGLARILGLEEQDGVTTVAPELMPVLAIESDRPEWAFLKDEVLGVGRTEVAAVANQTSFVQLFNPSGSNVLIVIEQIAVGAGVAAFARVRSHAAALGATTGDENFRDLRRRGNTGPLVAELRSGNQAAQLSGFALETARIVASTYMPLFSAPIVVSPGTGISVQSDAPATGVGLEVFFRWSERGAALIELR